MHKGVNAAIMLQVLVSIKIQLFFFIKTRDECSQSRSCFLAIMIDILKWEETSDLSTVITTRMYDLNVNL